MYIISLSTLLEGIAPSLTSPKFMRIWQAFGNVNGSRILLFVGIKKSYSLIINHLIQLFASLVRDRRSATIVAALLALQSNHLNHLSPETNWWVEEGLFISIDDRTLPNQIGLAR